MKNLPPSKRNYLFLVLIVTLALIGSVYFFLIGPQSAENKKTIQETSDRLTDLSKYKQLIKEGEATSNQLAAVSLELSRQETDVASGDVYAWIYDTLHRFKAGYHLDIPAIGQPTLSDVDMLPNFPYRQIRLSLNGTGYYHDLGKFVADFENAFPHMRLVDLTISTADTVKDSEILAFHLDVVALVKPNS